MDHEAVVRQKMTERYLLNELDPDVRDEFEDHFFDCPDCARDMRAGSEFVEHTKIILGESAAPVSERVRSHASQSENPGWAAWLPVGFRLAWFRPIWTVPALAVLLLVIGYQNLVTYPQLRGQLSQPRVLPWAAVAIGTWGGESHSLTLRQGSGFLVIVRIPADGAYSLYKADLYNPQGRLECSINIPAVAGQDQWPVQFPGASRESGTYKLSVHGVSAAGDSKDLGSTTIALQIQN